MEARSIRAALHKEADRDRARSLQEEYIVEYLSQESV